VSRHRRRSQVPASLRAATAGLMLAGVAAVVWVGYSRAGGSECTTVVRLTVAAAPEVAPAVETTARRWTGGGARVQGHCVAVDVSAASSADVAAAVAGRLGVSLAGVGQGGERLPVPDVWVPDSTTWLTRLQAAAAGLVPAGGPSLARSAIVVAMPEPVARQLGWPGRRLSYPDLLNVITANTELHPGIVDPGRDAGGLAGALALSRAAASVADPAKTTEAVLRSLAVGDSTVRQDLLNKFPRQPDPASLASAKVTVAPLPEQAVIAYNAGRPPVRLAAFYLAPEPPPLDYPCVAMPGLNSDQATAAGALRGVLAGTGFRDALAKTGLRAADGTAGAGFAAPRGAPADVTPTPSAGSGGVSGSGGDGSGAPDAAAVGAVLRTWDTVTARS
jgi:Ca-activated chloride channel family protein